jgi:hippurate hydrolase
VLRNGDGPTVMLRADMDALPVRETSVLSYASEITVAGADGERTPVAHVCGPDMHLAWLAGVTSLLSRNRADWHGTVLAVCQPAEEAGSGAEDMVADGLTARFPRPEVILGQHVARAPVGFLGTRPGVLMASSDALHVRMFGRGGHGAMPELSIDPIVMAAATVLRLQTVVSRETAAAASAVVTVGTLHAGTKENVIAEEAILGLSVRALDADVRARTLAAVRRIVEAEAQASGAPRRPEIEVLASFELTENDPEATSQLVATFTERFGPDAVVITPPAPASEDFGVFGRAWQVPSVFWFVGGSDPAAYFAAMQEGRLHELPSNHHPAFAPLLQPTLTNGIEAMLSAAGAWLA